MSEIIEEIYQGYCRAIDSSRMVTCEYSKENDKMILEYTDCGYGACVHSKTCKIMAQAHTEAYAENKVYKKIDKSHPDFLQNSGCKHTKKLYTSNLLEK